MPHFGRRFRPFVRLGNRDRRGPRSRRADAARVDRKLPARKLRYARRRGYGAAAGRCRFDRAARRTALRGGAECGDSAGERTSRCAPRSIRSVALGLAEESAFVSTLGAAGRRIGAYRAAIARGLCGGVHALAAACGYAAIGAPDRNELEAYATTYRRGISRPPLRRVRCRSGRRDVARARWALRPAIACFVTLAAAARAIDDSEPGAVACEIDGLAHAGSRGATVCVMSATRIGIGGPGSARAKPRWSNSSRSHFANEWIWRS